MWVEEFQRRQKVPIKTLVKHLFSLWPEWMLRFEMARLNAVFGWRRSCGSCAFIMKGGKKKPRGASRRFNLAALWSVAPIVTLIKGLCRATARNRHAKLSTWSTCSHCAAADNWLGLGRFSLDSAQLAAHSQHPAVAWQPAIRNKSPSEQHSPLGSHTRRTLPLFRTAFFFSFSFAKLWYL